MIYKDFKKIVLKDDSVPVIVLSYNNHSYVKKMVDFLLSKNIKNILIWDNASTSFDTKFFLKNYSSLVDVFMSKINYGPRVLFENKEVYDILPNVFVVTDPDIGLNEKLPDNFIYEMLKISERFSMARVGCALNLDIKEKNILDNVYMVHGSPMTIRAIENNMYKVEFAELKDSFGNKFMSYLADIDTTFVLYNKKYSIFKTKTMNYLRLDGVYKAEHYGWYEVPPIPQNEYQYYSQQCESNKYASTEKLKRNGFWND